MSFRVMAEVVDVQGIKSTQKFILLMLADRANETGLCWPSLDKLAHDCCIANRATVSRNLKALEDAGLIEIIRRTKDGSQLPNHYRINFVGVGRLSNRGGSKVVGGVGRKSNTNLSLEPTIEPKDICNSEIEAVEDPIRTCSETGADIPAAPKTKRFIKPTVQEVESYMFKKCQEKGFGTSRADCRKQAEKFWHHHETGNWSRGKTKIKIWRSAVSVWMSNDFDKVFNGAKAKAGGFRI